MTNLDREVAQQAARLQAESKRLLRIAEETRRSYLAWLRWQAQARRN